RIPSVGPAEARTANHPTMHPHSALPSPMRHHIQPRRSRPEYQRSRTVWHLSLSMTPPATYRGSKTAASLIESITLRHPKTPNCSLAPLAVTHPIGTAGELVLVGSRREVLPRFLIRLIQVVSIEQL